MNAHNADIKKAGSNITLAAVIAERDKYEELISHGKGEWNKDGYVRDETWACWEFAVMVLNRIIHDAESVCI